MVAVSRASARGRRLSQASQASDNTSLPADMFQPQSFLSVWKSSGDHVKPFPQLQPPGICVRSRLVQIRNKIAVSLSTCGRTNICRVSEHLIANLSGSPTLYLQCNSAYIDVTRMNRSVSCGWCTRLDATSLRQAQILYTRNKSPQSSVFRSLLIKWFARAWNRIA